MKTATCLTFSLNSFTELMDSAEYSVTAFHNILNIMSPGHKNVCNALELAWDVIDHYRSQTLSPPANELEKLSAITYKLNCVSKQIKTIESKICDPLLKIIPHDPQSTISFSPNV